MEEKKIYVCINKHHYLEGGKCPFCGADYVKVEELRAGDCVKCGQLCPDGAYACNESLPIDIDGKNYN